MSDGPNPGLWGGIQDPELDALIKSAISTADPQQTRANSISQAWKRVMDKYYTIGLGQAPTAYRHQPEGSRHDDRLQLLGPSCRWRRRLRLDREVSQRTQRKARTCRSKPSSKRRSLPFSGLSRMTIIAVLIVAITLFVAVAGPLLVTQDPLRSART